MSAIFCNTSEPYSYDNATDSWVITPGSEIQYRSEGWGESYFGEYGLGCIPDITMESHRVILLWGDSYVEAMQVDDSEKIAQQLTRLLQHEDVNQICAARGMSGDNIADYIENIPQYENQIPSIDTHIIFISCAEDILPDQKDDSRVVFQTGNGYHFVTSDTHYSFQNIKSFANRVRMYFAWPLLRKVTQNLSLRFSLGPVKTMQKSETQSNNNEKVNMKEVGDFLAKSLRDVTSKNIIIVYAPHVPRISNNKILYNDADWDFISYFMESCSVYNISFINMYDPFVNYYKKTGKFPRGFANSRPGEGHLNVEGHRIVAETIFEYMEKTRP